MRFLFTKQAVIAILVIVALGVGLFTLIGLYKKAPEAPVPAAPVAASPKYEAIGKSVEGRSIEAYTFGSGATHLVFVGGIHGGYEWNSVLLAYNLKDYLDVHPEAVPENLSVTVILSANPDAVVKVTGKEGRFTLADVTDDKAVLASARFNANGVDLNRNFDCKWQPKSTWQNKTVSAGTKAFSEPEAAALRDFLVKTEPAAAVFWHSQAGAVYASQCEDGILPKTLAIMNVYAKAAGYKAVESFDAYATTGASEDWLASIGIPAITVELTTHETVEWEKNLAGTLALFEYYRRIASQK
ncbi:MAG: M14 family metallopeptidase [bacterium]|nr:M14 family metallopeptidase [bacterium]